MRTHGDPRSPCLSHGAPVVAAGRSTPPVRTRGCETATSESGPGMGMTGDTTPEDASWQETGTPKGARCDGNVRVHAPRPCNGRASWLPCVSLLILCASLREVVTIGIGRWASSEKRRNVLERFLRAEVRWKGGLPSSVEPPALSARSTQPGGGQSPRQASGRHCGRHRLRRPKPHWASIHQTPSSTRSSTRGDG